MTLPLEMAVYQGDPLKHYLKRGDTGPSIRRTLIDPETGLTVDLTDATAEFVMVERDTLTEVIRTAATIESPETAGIIRYDFSASDTSAAGSYFAEFQVEFSDGSIITYPTGNADLLQRHISILISELLGSFIRLPSTNFDSEIDVASETIGNQSIGSADFDSNMSAEAD